MKDICTSIEYAGMSLPVVLNDSGAECVPLKPLSDLFGLQWLAQYNKCVKGWLRDFLGTCVITAPDIGGQSRAVVCIRIDRVDGYILSVNPRRVRSGGNLDGAHFLELKHLEWADSLRAYLAMQKLIKRTPKCRPELMPSAKTNAIALEQSSCLLKAMRERWSGEDPEDIALLGAAIASLDEAISFLCASSGIPVESAIQPNSHSGDLFESGN